MKKETFLCLDPFKAFLKLRWYTAIFTMIRGVARTVVMCRHLNETVGFTEAHSAEWGQVQEGVTPSLGGGVGSGAILDKFLLRTYQRYFQDQIYSN